MEHEYKQKQKKQNKGITWIILFYTKYNTRWLDYLFLSDRILGKQSK